MALAVLMGTMVFANCAQAQTDLYKGKTELSCGNEKYYVNRYGFGRNYHYFIGKKDNTRIKEGGYTLPDGRRMTRMRLFPDPADMCEDYVLKMKNILNTVFTQQQIAQFVKDKSNFQYLAVLNFDGQVIEMEYIIGNGLMTSVPFDKYHQLDKQFRTLKFVVSEEYIDQLKYVKYLIVELDIDFAKIYK